MRTLSHHLDAVGRGLAASAVAVLPFQALGGRPLAVFGILPFDLLIALAAAACFPRLWAGRRLWFAAPAAWMVLAVAGSGALSELLQPQPDLARRLAEQLAPLVAVLVIASSIRAAPQSCLVRRAALWGGGLAISGSVAGWVLDQVTGHHWFSDPALHPLFDGLPRLFGTFAGSPQRQGSFVVYWLTLVLATPGAPWETELRRRTHHYASLGLGAIALLLSMSYAWMGALVLAAARAPQRLRAVALGVTLLAIVAASVPLTRGPRSAELAGPCRALDVSHYLALRIAAGQCRQVSESGRAITAYYEAKRVSALAFWAHPWAGVGYVGFADFARQSFERRYGTAGIHYTQPHGVFHGLPAKHGLLGLATWALWLYALQRGWRASSWDWGVVAFLVIGLHIDVDRLREFWVLLAFLLAEQLSRCGATDPELALHPAGQRDGVLPSLF